MWLLIGRALGGLSGLVGLGWVLGKGAEGTGRGLGEGLSKLAMPALLIVLTVLLIRDKERD